MSEITQAEMDTVTDQLVEAEDIAEGLRQDVLDMTVERDVAVAKVERLQEAIAELASEAELVARGR